MTVPQLNTPEVRLVRSLLPAVLVREVDEIVLSGQGGYATREEFIREAIQNHVLEVKHGIVDGGRPGLAPEVDQPEQNSFSTSTSSVERRAAQNGTEPSSLPAAPHPPDALADASELTPIDDLAETTISPPAEIHTIPDGLARVREEPMLGLHNRDYPSIWVARLLAERSQDGPVPAQDFFAEATREAWRYAHRLLGLEKRLKVKLTALFPTNIAKAQAAEEGFQAFAIGELARRPNDDGTIKAAGPLFLWGACQLERENGRLLIGLTDNGRELLEASAGLTLAWPHDGPHAQRFLTFLRARARWDWAGFATLLDAVAERPNREELGRRFQSWHPDWTDAKANTNAAGYVARAREWGLLEPKLIDRRYALTDLGDEIRAGAGS